MVGAVWELEIVGGRDVEWDKSQEIGGKGKEVDKGECWF